MPYLLSVDIDGRVHIDSVKFDKVTITRHRLAVERKVFTIPTDTTRQCTTSSATGITYKKITLYRPIMWQVQYPPMSIIIRLTRHLHRIGKDKPPTNVKVLTVTSLSCQSNKDNRKTKE